MTRDPGSARSLRCALFVALTIAVLATHVTKSCAEVSRLWGQHGERWSPDSRLPDFSFAGYRRGEQPFRVPRTSVSIKSFGAKGDGRTDDTEAFRQTIAAGEGKVIELPAGRYRLSDALLIRASNLILRGAGSESTVLEFIRPLEAIHPKPANTDGGQPTSGWSWGGGLITIGGKSSSTGTATLVTGEARRGGNILELEAAGFGVGDELILTLRDDRANTLLRDLYRGDTGHQTPYENLYADIDGGEGTRLFASSGGLNRGQHSAAGATFWNIRSKRKVGWPSKLGPDAVSVVGVSSDEPPLLEPEGRWFEPIPPEELRPKKLHQAMLQRRSTLE